MKTLLLYLLMIGALLLIGSTCGAQSKESDRDWIDSLAVTYRNDFIEGAMLLDEATLDSLEVSVDVLVFQMRNPNRFERVSTADLVNAIRKYDDEMQAQILRRYSYKEEIRLARTNFSEL